MYSSRFKIFLCLIILGTIFGFLGFFVLPKFKKDKNKNDKLALVDLTTLDSDKDGLSDKKELELGTNPYSTDTDGDGYSDFEEVKSGHSPLKIESYDLVDEDGDGLTLEEERKYGTNPKNPDTDYDGYPDGLEIAAGYDPLKTDLSSIKKIAAKEETDNKNSPSLLSKVNAAENLLSANNLSDFETNLIQLAGGGLPTGGQTGNKGVEILNFPPENISNQDLKIKKEANKEVVQAYINSLAILAFKSLPFSALDMQETQNFLLNLDPHNSNLIKDNIKILEDTIISLKNLEVPNDEEIILWHKKLISFLLETKSLANSWLESNNNLEAMLGIFQQTTNLANYGAGELLPQLHKIAEKYNVQLPQNDFFQKIPRR